MPWEFEPDRSLIEFSAEHLGVATLNGRFSTADLKLDLNEEDPTKSSLEATVG